MTENEFQLRQDVPDHELGQTSSIGPLWPPKEASFGRIKGIYTLGIIDSEELIVPLVSEIEAVNFDENISRVSLRAVADLDYLRSEELIRPYIEAVIPLVGTQGVFKNTALVYFGRNDINRRWLPEEIKLYLENVSIASERIVIPAHESVERVLDNGYQLDILDIALNDQLEQHPQVQEIFRLYERFGWGLDEVIEIIMNPDSILSVATYNREIVSSGIAEIVKVGIGENQLRMVEITEAATRDDHARNGLYTAVSSTLLLEIAGRSRQGSLLNGEIDVIFGECNGNALGVLKTVKTQGRTLAVEVSESLGFPGTGMLEQHVPISGAPSDTPYNDLFPAYLTRERLYELY